MKDKIKGKIVKENRPKFNHIKKINCECISCDWSGDVIDTDVDVTGHNTCPICQDQVLIYED
jgi:hypothetical protein